MQIEIKRNRGTTITSVIKYIAYSQIIFFIVYYFENQLVGLDYSNYIRSITNLVSVTVMYGYAIGLNYNELKRVNFKLLPIEVVREMGSIIIIFAIQLLSLTTSLVTVHILLIEELTTLPYTAYLSIFYLVVPLLVVNLLFQVKANYGRIRLLINGGIVLVIVGLFLVSYLFTIFGLSLFSIACLCLVYSLLLFSYKFQLLRQEVANDTYSVFSKLSIGLLAIAIILILVPAADVIDVEQYMPTGREYSSEGPSYLTDYIFYY